MDYNNYYTAQPGHPPPNQQHGGGPQMQHQQPTPQQGGQMIQPLMTQQRNIRQTAPPGPPNHHQQLQPIQSQQHIGHHPQQQQQQIPSQQQHPNYQQVQGPLSHGPPTSHSSSPHTQHHHHHQQQQQQQQQQHHHHNHSHPPNNMHVAMSQQQQPIPQHVQSPRHHGPPMHIQQQQPLNQIPRPQMGPSIINHPQQTHHHQQNFFGGGGPMPQPSIHHYPQNLPHHQQTQQHPPPPVMHHGLPPMPTHHPHMQQNMGRNSPYFPNILQTEFRIIELNRRLQCRPIPSHSYNPLPSPYDENIWWEKFASEFFEDDATLTIRMHDDQPVEYTIGRTLIPRFFRSYFDGGVTDLSINLRNPKETCIQPHLITLDCDQAFIVTSNISRQASITTSQSVVVHTEGHLILDFVSNNFDNFSIKSWRFYIKGSREYIDRSLVNTLGLSHSNHHNSNHPLAEPITRQGITKSTITYLKMCMIMEPMQELMFQHKQTKLDPRACLRKFLLDRGFKSGDDAKTATNKRRKRKPSVATAVTGNATNNKKSKSGLNAMGNNMCVNNMMMSPSGGPSNFSLASQDVMVVGEPSMMGGDFGDDNERMITRLENTQYDPTASTPSNAEESDSLGLHPDGDMINNRDEIDSSITENHTMSPISTMQQVGQPIHQLDHQQLAPQLQSQQCNQVPQHSTPDQNQQVIDHAVQEHIEEGLDKSAISLIDTQNDNVDLENESTINDRVEDIIQRDLVETINQSQTNVTEHHDGTRDQDQELNHLHDQTGLQQTDQNGEPVQLSHQPQANGQQSPNQDPQEESIKNCEVDKSSVGQVELRGEVSEDTKINSLSNLSNNTTMVNNIHSVDQAENHNSVQTLNEESNSNSQLGTMPCSTANASTAMEQQQPVDNGIAIASGCHNDHC